MSRQLTFNKLCQLLHCFLLVLFFISCNTSKDEKVQSIGTSSEPEPTPEPPATTEVNFSTISTMSVSEGNTTTSASLSCSSTTSSATPLYGIKSQTPPYSKCTITNDLPYQVSCTPEFRTGHDVYTSTLVMTCSIDGTIVTQNVSISVADTNRSPSLSSVDNQIVWLGTSMETIDVNDSNSGTDVDLDLDTISYSCSFTGGAYTSATDCDELPGISNFINATGVLTWTPNVDAGNSQAQTDYAFTVTGTDSYDSDPASSTVTFTVQINMIPELTYTSTTPASPINSTTTPVIDGSADDVVSSITLYNNADCSSQIGLGTRADYMGSGITAAITANATTIVYGQGTDGLGHYSNCTLLTTILHDNIAPSDPVVTAPSAYHNATTLNIAWTNSSDTNFTTHTIKACTGNDCTTGCVGETTDTSTPGTLSSLVDGTTYYICVQGADSAGNTSNWGVSATPVVIDTTNPVAPVMGAQTTYVNTTSAAITWTNGSDTNFDTHNLKACTDTACSTNCVGETTDVSSGGTLSNLVNGTIYYICGQSVDLATNTSSWVASTNTMTVDTEAPATPVVDAPASYHNATSLTITWSGGADTNFSTFNIKGCTSNDCNTGCLATTQDPASDGTLTGLADGSSYYVCVQSEDLAGNTSAWGVSATPVIIDTTNPTDPTVNNPATFVNATTAAITWGASTDTNLSTYNIKGCINNNCSTGCATETQDNSSGGDITALADGSSYYVCVQAVDRASNTSNWVASATTVTVDTTNPTNPTVNDPATIVNTTSAAITWGASTDTNLSTYNIKGCTSNNCSTGCGTETQDPASGGTITGLADGGIYYVCVQAVDAATNTSDWVASTNTVTVDTTNPTDPTVNDPAQYVNATSAAITWGASTDTNLSTYNIKGCTNNDCSTGCATETQDPASGGTITGLVNGSSYYVCVQAVDSATNTSNWVASTNTVTVDTTNPTDPTVNDPASFVNANSAAITWGASVDTNLSTYNIKGCTNNDCSTGCATETQDTASGGNITGLADGSSYYVCVQAVDLATNTSNWVASTNTVTVDTTTPTDPTVNDPASFVNATSAAITWGASTDTNLSTYNIKGCTNNDCSTGCATETQDPASGGSITGLTNGSSYYVCVQAVDDAANTSNWVASSNTVTVDTTNPTDPTVNDPASFVNATSAAITWGASTDTNLSTYNIKGCTNNDCSTGCATETQDPSSGGTITGLTNGSSYYVCVQAVDSATNTSNWVASSNTVTVDTTNPTDPTVNDPASFVNATSAAITWGASTDTNLSTYNIKGCTNNDCSTGCATESQDPASGGSITGLASGSSYYVCVQAVDSATNTSNWVASTNTVTVDTTNPTDPTVNDPASFVTTTSAAITWGASTDTNLSTYNIKGCTNNDCSTGCATETQDPASGGSITGLTNGSSYYVCVQAVDDAANTSNWVASTNTVTVDTVNPTDPTVNDPASFVNATTAAITWGASTDTNLSTYNIKGCTNNDCSTGCATETQDPASGGSITGLSNGSSYYVCVQAEDAAGRTSNWVASTGTVTVDTTNPTDPTVNDPSSFVSTTSAAITWGASTDTNLSTYNIKGCTNNDCSTGCAAETQDPASGGSITGLTGGSSYYVCVQAVDSATNTSNWVASSGTVTVDTTNPTDPTVNDPSSYSNATSAAITWGASTDTNLSTYNIKGCTNNDCSTGCATESQDPASGGTITGLSNGSSYYVCVQAEDSAGRTSNWVASSNTVTIDTTNPVAPSSVTDPSSYHTATTLSIAWTGGSDANFSTFNIQGCTNNDCATGCATESQDNSSPGTISGLVDGSTYYLCVQTVDLAGNTSSYTASSGTVIIDTTDPTDPTVNDPSSFVQTTSAAISWGASTDTNLSTYNIKGCTNNDCSTGCATETQDSASPGTITGLSNGNSYYVCVQAEDSAGRTSNWVASSGTVTVDTTDPTDPTVNDPSSYTTTTTAAITWGASTDTNLSTYNIKGCTNNDCSTGCATETQDAASGGTITGLTNGSSYYVCVQAVDSAARTSNWVASSGTVTVDTTDPTDPTVNDPSSYVNATSAAISWGASTDTNLSTYNIKGCTNNDCSTGCATETQDAASPGTITGLSDPNSYYVCVQAVDAAGRTSNWVASTGTVTVDTTNPSDPSVTNPSNYNLTTSLTITWSGGADTNFSTFNIKACENNDCSTSCSSTVQDTTSDGTITGLTNGTSYYVCVQSEDLATNTSSWTVSSQTVQIDTTNPTDVVTVTDTTYSNSTTETPTLNWTASTDGESGVSHYEVSIGSTAGATDIVGWTNNGASQTTSFNSLSLTTGNDYFTNVRAYDNAGRVSNVTSSDGWTVDTSGPTDNTATATSCTASEFAGSWSSSSDPTSGISHYEYSIGTSGGDTSIVSWTNAGSNLSVTRSGLTLTLGSTYFINTRVQNGAGGYSNVDSASVTCADLNDSLNVFWKMNEASGNRSDHFGSHTLVDNNTVTSTAGVVSNALVCDASNDEYLSLATHADFEGANTDFSISLWVYIDDVGNSTPIVTKWGGTTDEYYLEWQSAGQFRWRYGTGVHTHAEVLSSATWYHVVAWHDATNDSIGISVNGTSSSKSYSAGATAGDSDLNICGDHPATTYMNGRIDAVGIYGRVLTSGEISSLYNSGSGLEPNF